MRKPPFNRPLCSLLLTHIHSCSWQICILLKKPCSDVYSRKEDIQIEQELLNSLFVIDFIGAQRWKPKGKSLEGKFRQIHREFRRNLEFLSLARICRFNNFSLDFFPRGINFVLGFHLNYFSVLENVLFMSMSTMNVHICMYIYIYVQIIFPVVPTTSRLIQAFPLIVSMH